MFPELPVANPTNVTAEHRRLQEANDGTASWKNWGPYLSDRQWGTVREDYSPDGNAWDYFPFDHANKRAYRWGEDGIAGVSDAGQRLCMSLALWNGKDPILKERLYGVPNEGGNHGEDVKELYYHLDATPTHSYLKYLYKYPQAEFPYRWLATESKRRSRTEPEFELLDTGLFNENKYFDVYVEYAKASPTDLLMRINVINRGPDTAELNVIPQVWYRNTWSWTEDALRPAISADGQKIRLLHFDWDEYVCHFDGTPNLLFTDNDTNQPKLYRVNKAGYFKDGINEAVVQGNAAAVNPERTGTKAAGHYQFTLPPGGFASVRVRLRHTTEDNLDSPFADFDDVMSDRAREADEFFAVVQDGMADDDAKLIHRQAIAGLIWTKQYFEYDVWQWLHGDSGSPPPPRERMRNTCETNRGRNVDWEHLKNADIVSMPDKWEYPWYASWDLAFHTIPLATVDAAFAKEQLLMFLRESYMHPNGQLPAYEWNFGDANPPVHAWASWRVFQIDREQRGDKGDIPFLERIFHKLTINFTWWVNRKDANGRNVFQGGFLGLDNIGVFDRSRPLPMGGYIIQADATGWMAMYSLNLMRIALELALHDNVYEDMAIKFFEHFLGIARAMTDMAGKGIGLWDEQDLFYYDELTLPDGTIQPLRVRSMVGLIPLFAVEVLEPELLARVPKFASRMRWILENRPDLSTLVSRWFEGGRGERRLLSLLRGHRMKKLLRRVLDEGEFLSDFGIRSLSKAHKGRPFTFEVSGEVLKVDYQPAESTIPAFGGNSNWRGPIWFPMNYLIVESLHKFHHYYGEDFKVECPTGSGNFMSILDVAKEISSRLTRIFLKDQDGRRPVNGWYETHQSDPHFRDHVPFYEYFHGDTGMGLGASHQTGWTALVAKLLLPSESVFTDLCGSAARAVIRCQA
ncbi:putative (alpha/alpha)-barrel-type glycoside hydrolase [Limnoglobus roseus]|uniref:Putative (Alpha/alpha)-barrel-type glycoside hydrolase n=2 Tax=Limnoglobus roseus TaxID=2598579 RepID=A0A5C1AG61_9BACT|nr:putative (alpha/alpha)-barrel-type glycoside hydrolase [Limnoglobus roseus]